MAELKTKKTAADVEAFLRAIDDPTRREDCFTVLELMKKATKSEPKMWGTSIVGFGEVHYKYASGHEGDTCLLGFASRKAALTLYGCDIAAQAELLKKLGKHKTGKGCLYIRSLADVDRAALKALIQGAVARRPAFAKT